MLKGIDDIPWGRLQHAYGPADDVPVTLKALAAHEMTTAEAVEEFWGNICHQGTVYEATSYVVPFLIDLLSNPTLEGRWWLLLLLASIGSGSSYRDVHGNDLVPEQIEEFEQGKQQELAWVERAHVAVREGILLYLNLFQAAERETRAAAARTLACFPERSPEITRHLHQHFVQEHDSQVQASLLLCLEALGDRTQDTRVLLERSLDESADPILRLVAATILTRLDREETPGNVIQILLGAVADPEPVTEKLVLEVWDKESVDEEVCQTLICLEKDTARSLLIRLLPAAQRELTYYSIIDALLETTFEMKFREAVRPQDITVDQRRVLTALAGNEAVWRGNATMTLKHHYGLPEKRDELQEFLMKG